MKSILKPAIIAVMAFTFSSTSIKSQTDEVQMIQGMYGMQKRDIVKQYMALSETEAPKFWAVYDAYENERKKLGAERIKIISDYADAYQSMTGDKADNIVQRIFASDVEYAKMHKTYYEKVKKEIGALKAAVFLQLEIYLQTAIRFEIQDSIPFIGELDKTKKH